jgi:hypothetical protein
MERIERMAHPVIRAALDLFLGGLFFPKSTTVPRCWLTVQGSIRSNPCHPCPKSVGAHRAAAIASCIAELDPNNLDTDWTDETDRTDGTSSESRHN